MNSRRLTQKNADERRLNNNNEKSAHISVNPRQENKTTTPNQRQKKEEPKILRIERIFSGYKKREVLKGISLEIKKGEVVAVIGKNGAGKSTLLKAIMGFLPVWEGNIYLNEDRITNKPPYLIQNKGIGYLMQGGRIFPHLTIQENLEVAGNRLTKNLLKNRIKEMCETLPFLKNRNLRAQAGSLSGGERHQLSLGMVLMNDLDLLLLDEPSAGLSPVNVDKMYEILEEVKNERRLSILLIEQKVTEAVKFSARVCLLESGLIKKEEKCMELATIDDLSHFFFGGIRGFRLV
jgi:branched-chain amino acid transport system ATP-binding protein